MRSLQIALFCFASIALAMTPACGGGGSSSMVCEVDAGPRVPGAIVFMEACDICDDKCVATEQCFEYGEGGTFCSHTCTVDADCPAPSRGCNNKGICKRP